MFVLMSLGGVVLAPLGYELYRARVVAEQARVITEMNGQYVLARRRNSYSAWLATRIWPQRSEFLGREVQITYFDRNVCCELTPLKRVPSLRELRLSGPVTVSDPNFAHAGIQRLDLCGWGEHATSSSFAESRILTRFPFVEEVQLISVVPSQSLVNDLGNCRHMEGLTIFFDERFVPGPSTEMTRIDFAPFKQLQRLRRLSVTQAADSTDWSILTDLKQLEDVRLGPAAWDGTMEKRIKHQGSVLPPEQTPLHYLCDLPALK